MEEVPNTDSRDDARAASITDERSFRQAPLRGSRHRRSDAGAGRVPVFTAPEPLERRLRQPPSGRCRTWSHKSGVSGTTVCVRPTLAIHHLFVRRPGRAASRSAATANKLERAERAFPATVYRALGSACAVTGSPNRRIMPAIFSAPCRHGRKRVMTGPPGPVRAWQPRSVRIDRFPLFVP
ncbi:hypothetical protein AN920_04640 [Pseudomonas paraeruginosa]|nr:hypothetical protein AN920_04640 [Pseudomonas paraeruginosa]